MSEILEFRTWKMWVAQCGRCQAMTQKGLQCRNDSAVMGVTVCSDTDFHDVDFVLGVTDRCRVHAQVRERVSDAS